MSGATAPASPEEPTGPSIQIITMNGFTILESDGANQEPNERRFLVKSPSGSEHEVLVEIDEEAVGYVERMTRRRLPAENSFWTSQADAFVGRLPLARRENPADAKTHGPQTSIVTNYR